MKQKDLLVEALVSLVRLAETAEVRANQGDKTAAWIADELKPMRRVWKQMQAKDDASQGIVPAGTQAEAPASEAVSAASSLSQ